MQSAGNEIAHASTWETLVKANSRERNAENTPFTSGFTPRSVHGYTHMRMLHTIRSTVLGGKNYYNILISQEIKKQLD